MNVENIQKLNQVARDLLKHGLAQSMDEAVRKAQQMANAQTVADSESVGIENRPDTLTVSPATAQKQPQEQHHAEEKKGGTIMDTIQGNTGYVTLEEFNKLKATVKEQDERISMIISKMNDLIRELNTLASQVRKMGDAPRQAREEESQQRQAEERKPAQQAAAGSTPRVGNFTSEDVAIEKFFYSGPKK